MAAEFVTIGHSDRPLDEFLGMLTAAGVGLVLDVRRFPRSRANPTYNIDRLPDDLAPLQIGYRHWPAFGGRRPKQRDVDERVNGLWREQSFHNYADYALGDEYSAAFQELTGLAEGPRPALMCAEAVWWRCHRRIITDYLLFAGHSVDHLMNPGQTDAARATPGAVAAKGGRVVYPVPDAPPLEVRS